ncbi:hypothetical protein RHSIM_Rhsim03G0270300 [Rhododendron simsii]|uniref:Beta-amyrin synthase n=1 Tax=Rhododendron simsii TaxID=118357 RepID=A0A834LQL5_RHOSS|nr:hypothetical protein RHSIM_Rhsim03G0270300 [Rhododendron simsii]
MWKLKIAEREGPWLTTTNNHVGRQHWEFDHEAGTPQERDQVERYREEFTKNRFQIKQSADLLMRMQVIALYVTGAVNKILSPEHQKEIIRYICNHQVLCLTACYVEDPNSEAYKRHLARIPDYFWLAEDGMKMQSRNGGFPAWEPKRAFSWLEVTYDALACHCYLISLYVECTASAIQGLVLFRQLHPGHLTKEIDSCITRAIKYIEETQNPDGSW